MSKRRKRNLQIWEVKFAFQAKTVRVRANTIKQAIDRAHSKRNWARALKCTSAELVCQADW